MSVDFKKTFGVWSEIQGADLANMVCTGKRFIYDCVPDYDAIRAIGKKRSSLHVLDFGCGFGRNLHGMLEYSDEWMLSGYDCQRMFDAMPSYFEAKRNEEALTAIDLSDNWDYFVRKAQEKPFDAILAVYVFQHIAVTVLREYMNDIRFMTNRLVVFGRRWHDSYHVRIPTTWDLLLEQFDIIECPRGFDPRAGDPEENSLVVLRPKISMSK